MNLVLFIALWLSFLAALSRLARCDEWRVLALGALGVLALYVLGATA